MTNARKHPLLARLVVSLLATLIAFVGSVVAVGVALSTGHETIAQGIVVMLPLTAAWISAALVQNLVKRDDQ